MGDFYCSRKIETMQLIMPFLNDPAGIYCLGYECGVAWVRMEQEYNFDNYSIHTKNVDQFKLMCHAFDYECRFKKIDATWTSFFAKKRIEKTIDQQIKDALEGENYELAARLKRKK